MRHGSKLSNTGFVIPACFWRESSPAQPLDSRQKHAGMTVGGAGCYPKQGISEPCRIIPFQGAAGLLSPKKPLILILICDDAVTALRQFRYTIGG